jgi:hypothetical protein
MASHFCLICGTVGGVDVILNILLFVPMGVGLSLSGVAPWRAVLTMLALSTSIETAQLLLIPGRDATLGDVVTNTLGGALGFAGCRYAQTWLRPSLSAAKILLIGWSTVWLAIQTISNFAFTLSIPDGEYYGQISPILGSYAAFRGRVLSAGVDGIAIPNTAIVGSRGLRTRLQHGGTAAATVVPDSATQGIAPILRVVDTDQTEVVLLAQDGVDLLFALRSGGAALRLRPPLFALRGVFAGKVERGSFADTIAVGGRQLARVVSMTANARTAIDHHLIPVAASLGWTLIWPWQWHIEGTRAERAISWIWVACLVLPSGYWAACVARSPQIGRDPRLRALVWSLGSVAVYAGLELTPRLFGVSGAPAGDLVAAGAGLLLGARLFTALASRTARAGSDVQLAGT